jgi:hypothetical protein
MIKKFIIGVVFLILMVFLVSHVYAGPPPKTVHWKAQVTQPYCPPPMVVYYYYPPPVMFPMEPPCVRFVRKVVSCPFRILDTILFGN